MKAKNSFLSIISCLLFLISCHKEPLTTDNSEKLIGRWSYDYGAFSNLSEIHPLTNSPQADFQINFDEKGYITFIEDGVESKFRVTNITEQGASYVFTGPHIWTNSFSLKKGSEKRTLVIGYLSKDSIITEQYPIDYRDNNSSGNPPNTKVNVFKKVN